MQESIYKIEWSLFIAMCENASLQEAAEAYGLSASAASRALRRLEDSLGANLFDRTCKPMVLTPEGKALYRKIKPAHVITKDALEAFKESNAKHPDLKIGFLDSFSLSVVPKFIERVKSSASSITCLTGSSDRLLERLAKREVDVILSSDPSLENSEYRRLLLIREPSIAIFPRSIEFYSTAPSWNHLLFCNFPFINSYGKSGRGKLLHSFLLTSGIALTGNLVCDSLIIKLQLVSDNVGWSITSPLSLVCHPEYFSKLNFSPLPSPGIERSIYLLGREDLPIKLFNEIAATICTVYEDNILPEMQKVMPNLAKQCHTRRPE